MGKTLKELGILVAVLFILNVSGLLPEITGAIQRAVLWTGLMNPDTEQPEDPDKADYNMLLRSADGDYLSLEQFKGKTIFINLWATWCGPCIAEMPNINGLYGDMKDNIVFIMLNLDDEQEKAHKFMERKGFDFPVYFPAGNIPKLYHTGTIPTTHVISPDGQLVFSKSGTANYNNDNFRTFLKEVSDSQTTENPLSVQIY